MRTRISKHGKYEIMDGSYGEMKDLLQAGDILRMLDVPEGMKRSDFDVRLVRRIPSQEIMDQVMENLPFPSKATAMFAMVESPTEWFSYSWAVQNLKSGMMYIWFGEHDDTPCVIKRRIDKETTTPEPQEKTKPQVPTEPGLYRDKDGDVAVFFRTPDYGQLSYMYIATDRGDTWNHYAIAMGEPARFAPWRRVIRINRIEVER